MWVRGGLRTRGVGTVGETLGITKPSGRLPRATQQGQAQQGRGQLAPRLAPPGASVAPRVPPLLGRAGRAPAGVWPPSAVAMPSSAWQEESGPGAVQGPGHRGRGEGPCSTPGPPLPRRAATWPCGTHPPPGANVRARTFQQGSSLAGTGRKGGEQVSGHWRGTVRTGLSEASCGRALAPGHDGSIARSSDT